MDFAKNPKNKIWVSNNDPHVLDTMYNRLLGPGGSKMLPEEVKWLAVTHKSFDQGRRGFNDRLALLGMPCLLIALLRGQDDPSLMINRPVDSADGGYKGHHQQAADGGHAYYG